MTWKDTGIYQSYYILQTNWNVKFVGKKHKVFAKLRMSKGKELGSHRQLEKDIPGEIYF